MRYRLIEVKRSKYSLFVSPCQLYSNYKASKDEHFLSRSFLFFTRKRQFKVMVSNLNISKASILRSLEVGTLGSTRYMKRNIREPTWAHLSAFLVRPCILRTRVCDMNNARPGSRSYRHIPLKEL